MGYCERVHTYTYHHKQKYRHYDARIAFNTLLYTFIYHIEAYYGKDSHIDDRRPLVRYETFEISISYWSIGIFYYIGSEIFQHPSAYHTVIGIDDVWHKKREIAYESPFLAEKLICSQWSLTRASSYSYLCDEERKAEGYGKEYVEQEEESASVSCCKIRETPDIA